MARPTQPKGLKPKSEGESESKSGSDSAKGKFELTGVKLIAVNTVITILVCLLFVGTNYFMIKNALTQIPTKSSEDSGDEDQKDQASEQPERGIVADLGEFIVNLSDPNARRYLKVNVALELSKTAEELGAKKESGGGGGEGEKVDPAVKKFQDDMDQFKPAIRDAVISVLSSKTAEELSSVAGKELAKEQIKEAVNAIFGGEREVLRVSFGNFIIQ